MEQDRLFVEVNDRIRKLADGYSTNQIWDFVCECPKVTCRSSVSLTLMEFDERRAASPPVPVHALEHKDDRFLRPPTTRRPAAPRLGRLTD
jgi:hypothetical protein